MKSIFRAAVLGLVLCCFGSAQAGGMNVAQCNGGVMECEYVLTYGWVCYCV
jgi:hypothetical protein